MERTKLTLKTIVDGFGMYILYYFWTSFLLWGGFQLLNLIGVSFWQVFGGVVVFRQVVGLIANRTDRHVKKESTDPRTEKTISQD
jgi:hypothetical protein